MNAHLNYYRRMLAKLLSLQQRRLRPVMEALDPLGRWADQSGQVRFHDPAERVPLEGLCRRVVVAEQPCRDQQP